MRHILGLSILFVCVIISFSDKLIYNLIVAFITLCSLPACPHVPLAYNTHFKNSFMKVYVYMCMKANMSHSLYGK